MTGLPIAVVGWGYAVPDGRVTNADLATRVDTNDAWIVERTGIRERRIAGPGESTATLATTAGADAIKRAGLAPDDIDLLIVATVSPEQPMPHTGAFVGEALGLHCGSFDVAAACAGFVYELVVGASMVGIGYRARAAHRRRDVEPHRRPRGPHHARAVRRRGRRGGHHAQCRRRAVVARVGSRLRRLGRRSARGAGRREPTPDDTGNDRRARALPEDAGPAGVPARGTRRRRLGQGHDGARRVSPPTTSRGSSRTRPTSASSKPPRSDWASLPSARS